MFVAIMTISFVGSTKARRLHLGSGGVRWSWNRDETNASKRFYAVIVQLVTMHQIYFCVLTERSFWLFR